MLFYVIDDRMRKLKIFSIVPQVPLKKNFTRGMKSSLAWRVATFQDDDAFIEPESFRIS